jgi:aspartyl-tRNA(Asn)/glutamyl-tRNA(Gln) amidotransferase subunit A
VIDSSLLFAPMSRVARLFRRRELSPVELLDSVLERLPPLEAGLNAFVVITADRARSQAREAERAFATGETLGPLAGIPVSLKDIFDVAGLPTTAGSRILRDVVATRDSAVYARLRDSGAVLVGKTNMLEFAYGAVHPDYGRTNNPWQPARSAGGSSGGSAASVAAGLAYGSVGTDTAGSIRCPAAFCGVVGLKPTWGSVDQTGMLPLSPTLDHIGLVTRTVGDNRVMFEALTGRIATRRPELPYKSVIGVVSQLWEITRDRDVRAAFTDALALLVDCGMDVREVSLPGSTTLWERAVEIAGVEAAHRHHAWLAHRGQDYATWTYTSLMAGRLLSDDVYREALATRRRFESDVDQVLDRVDFLATPTMPGAAPMNDADDGTDLMMRTVPFNMSRHPAITVPMRCSADGMPLGLQLIAERGGEVGLYALAQSFETALGGFPTLAGTPGLP